jgi:heme exporter protein A
MTDTSFKGPAIALKGVSKAYGRTVALRGLDLQVPWGQVLTVLGPNGSGKTSLIKILAMLSRPDSGTVRIAGLDPERDGQWIRQVIGVVTHDPLLYDGLTGRENLRFAARMFNVKDADARIESVSMQLGVTKRLDQRVGTLSHGWKKRISLSRALLHDPPILLMDEPESGLDQQALTDLEYIVKDESRPSRTVVLTTHNFERGLFLGDQVAIIAKGRLAYYEPTIDAPDPDALRETYMRHVGTAT